MRTNVLKALLVLVLAGCAVLLFEHSAAAFPASGPGDLVGTWRVTVTQVDCQTGGPLSPPAPPFSSLLTFNLGGTMVEDTTNPAFGPGQRGAGQGVWEIKGRGTYEAKSVAFINYTTPANPAAHNPGFEAGQQSITQTILFKDGPNKWSSTAAIEFTDVNGVVYRQGCAVASAERF